VQRSSCDGRIATNQKVSPISKNRLIKN